MGIFDKKPKAKLEVRFDQNTNGVYFPPGCEVSGTVRLTECAPNEHRNDLVVTLWGQSKVKWSERHGHRTDTYRSRSALLSIRQSVSQPSLQQDGSTMWTFKATIPSTLRLDNPPPAPGLEAGDFIQTWKDAEKFDTHAEQDLVPSCAFDQHSVDYHIAAELHTNDEKHNHVYGDANILLTVGPDNYHQEPVYAADRLVIKSALLDPAHGGNKLSFGEKASAMVSSSHLPHFTFSYSAMAPTQAAIGSPLRLPMTCRPDPSPSDAPEPEMVMVEGVDVTIRRLANFRTPDIFHTEKHKTDIRDIWTQSIPAGAISPLTAANKWEVIAQTGPVSVPNQDFSTFNLVCFYDLSVEWTLRCADEKHKIKVYVGDLNMYSDIGIAPPTMQMPPVAI